jgi:hypothetical protein
MTSHGQAIRRRRTHRGVPKVGVVVGVALGFVMGVVAEVLFMGGGWYSVLEEVLYPLAFVFELTGAFSGGFLLLAAEHDGDQRRAWRAATVFVTSSVFAALLFWGVA